jgi:hypothetical protein
MARRRWAVAVALSALLPLTSCAAKGSTTTSTPASAPMPTAARAVATTLSSGETQYAAPDQGTVMWGMSESGAAAQNTKPAYPLAVSPDRRYLVDGNGRPWRVQADAAWLMSSEGTPDQVDQYLTTRQSQGFNSFYLMAMVHPGGYKDAAPNAPNDINGDPPFATPNDFSTAGASPASARYWQWIDTIIAKAADHGMAVMLAYTYLGFRGGDQGWYAEVLSQRDRQTLFDWGKWLGARYRNNPNVIWFGLGDFAPPDGSEGAARAQAIADGIKAAGATQLFMAEPTGGDGIPSEVEGFGSILDMNSFYGYGPSDKGAVYETANQAYRIQPTLPAWMEEGTYEYENNTGTFSKEPWDTRRGRFWSVLGGGTAGDGFGSHEVWQWKNFPSSLQTPGADYSRYAFDLFASLPWWTLRPSGTDPGFAGFDLIPSGGGTFGKMDFITSALTQDRHWLLAYVPVTNKGARTFTVDTDALDGPVRARWFDPATGTYLAIGDGQLHAMSGQQSFTTPGKRADGTDDWVLVLDTEPDPCGAITATGLYTPPATAPSSGVTCEVTASRQNDLAIVSRSPAGVPG